MKHQIRIALLLPIAAALVLGLPALAQPCMVPDNGGGTADLPPAGCGYVSPDELHVMIDGLPPATTINIDAVHGQFFNVSQTPGGGLSGDIEVFESFLTLDMTGTGVLAGFSRNILMRVGSEVHTGPRVPGAPIQDFDTEMVGLQGQIFGDPDFDLLQIRAGRALGLPPSSGRTVLTLGEGGDWNVDSFFDVFYEIEFRGAPGSMLEGFRGSTRGTVRMGAGEPPSTRGPCIVEDNGSGTIDLPPEGCGYLSPQDVPMIVDGLPPGTEINVGVEHREFLNPTRFSGGTFPDGEVERFDSTVDLTLSGTGSLAGFTRQLALPAAVEIHSGPRVPGDPVQTFDTEMISLSASLFDDPDFDQLTITAGSGNGLPSPGLTSLTRLPGGDATSGHWNVDSFFDVEYRIVFTGAPGGMLDGLAGSTTGSVPMQAGVFSGGCSPLPQAIDVFPSTAKLVLEEFTSGAQPFVVRLSSADLSPTEVLREPQIGDTIETEIVQLELSGFHPRVGPIHVHLNPTRRSLGRLENVVLDPASCELISADSFFDVFVDIDLPDIGETWTNDQPLRLERKLDRLPPRDDPFESPFVVPVPVMDKASNQPRGQILYQLHHADPPFPPPGADCFDSTLDLDINLTALGLPPTHPVLVGRTTVLRGAPQTFGNCSVGGLSCSSNADCTLGETCDLLSNSVPIQLVEMQLTGSDPVLGPLEVRVKPGPELSLGESKSWQNDSTYRASSFFDVFFEVDVMGATLHNDIPLPVVAIGNGGLDGIRNTPPDPRTAYRTPGGQGSSDCCVAHAEPGCSDPDCENAICLVDTFCCNTQWDGICADEALREPLCLAGCGVFTAPLLTEDGIPVGEVREATHVIDTPRDREPPPPGDDDCFDSWVHLELTLDNPMCEEQLWLQGHFRVLRDDPLESPPGSGQERTDTLVVKAVFVGDSQCAGPLAVRLSPTESSSGTVSSLAPEEFFPADSFFDVFLEVDSGIGVLHTLDPTRMSTTINRLPPDDGEIYYGPGTVVPLYDQAGVRIGGIKEVSHEIHGQIECPADCRSMITFASREEMIVEIPGSGAGLLYDVWEGPLSGLGSFEGTLSQSAGPPVVPGLKTPSSGDGLYFLSRARFGAFGETWNSGGSAQVGNRDASLP